MAEGTEQQQDPRIAVNHFAEGLMSDLDNLHFPVGKFKDASNIELLNKDGQGFVVTLQDGNKQFFSLTPGFRPVGSVFINGILYIFSQSIKDGFQSYPDGSTVTFPNAIMYTEIGCFPSRKLNPYTGKFEFERVYKPLTNYTGSTENTITRDFRVSSSLLPILADPTKPGSLDIRAKQIYDGSINLYFTDGEHPLRVINTGFNQEGEPTERTYSDKDFKNLVNVVRGAVGHPSIRLDKVLEGGQLKSGNTFFYLRYVSEDFNKTGFLGESPAIPINNFPAVGGVSGSPGTHAVDDRTTKSVELEIKSLDTVYSYFELAMVRYYSEENGILVHENKLITNRYKITGSTMKIRVNGYESLTDIDFEEIIKPSNQEDVCASIEIVENRLWGANWKRRPLHKPELASFALQYRPFPKIITERKSRNAGVFTTPTYGDTSLYSDPKNFSKVGYFRGETYAFQMIFVYDDGSESMGYPTMGFDFYKVTPGQNGYANSYTDNPGLSNQKGIIRFPGAVTERTYSVTSDFVIEYRVMGIEFKKVGNAVSLPDGVVGYYFARAKRVPNLIAQGLMMHGVVSTIKRSDFLSDRQDLTIHPHQENESAELYTIPLSSYYNNRAFSLDSEAGYWGINQDYSRGFVPYASDFSFGTKEVLKVMPIYRGYYPIISYHKGSNWKYHMARGFYVKNHYGFFSPDYILDPTKKASTGVIGRIGKIHFFDPYRVSDTTSSDYASNTYDGLGPNKSYFQRRKDRYYGTKWSYISYPIADIIEQSGVQFNTAETFIEPESIENVEKYLLPTEARKFVSWYKDCGLNNQETGNQGDQAMIYGVQDDDSDKFMSNRSMVTPRYVGLILKEMDAGKNLNHELVNIYHSNPSLLDYNILSIYSLDTTEFFRVTQTLSPGDSHSFFGGDCFLQTSFIKIMGHTGSGLSSSRGEFAGDDGSFSERPKSTSSYVYRGIGHGVLMMFVTENSVNAELRVPVKSRTFFPLNPDIRSYAHIQSESEETAESDVLNWGYHQMLPPKSHAMFNQDLPDVMNSFPNRVRYSNRDIPGSFIDSFSTFEYLSYKDFDVSFGPMRRLFNLSGWLIGICEKSIVSFYLSENQIKADPSADNLLLGVSDVLHDKARTLIQMGSQNFHGSVSTQRSIIGLDLVSKGVFAVAIQSTDSGSFPAAVDKGEELMCKKYVSDFITAEVGDMADRANMLPESFVGRKGVFVFQDEDRVFLGIRGTNNSSIVFDAKMNMFLGRSDFSPAYAANMGNIFISWDADNKGWITSNDSPKATFFGQNYESYVQSVVNPFGIFEKVYDALVLHTPDKDVKRIEYKTETQETVHVFPTPGTPKRPWQDPVYKEDKLYVPTFPESKEFFGKVRHVHLRGTWLTVKVVFQRATQTYLKNILTKLRISKS